MKGYVAIASLLVITVLITLVGSTIAILGVDEGIASLSVKKGFETLDIVEACNEDAFLRISENGSVPAAPTLPTGACSTSVSSSSGAHREFTLNSTVSNHKRQFFLNIDRALPFVVNYRVEN